MNYLWVHRLGRSRYLLAIMAGLLLAASFPKLGIAGLAWVAPGLMLATALGKRGWECFRIGYVAGLTHYLASLYWLLLIPYRWHGIPFGPAAGWLALSAFIALYPATWVWLMCPRERTADRGGRRGDGAQASESKGPAPGESSVGTGYGLVSLADRVLARSWGRRALWALSGAAVWVALEMIVARLFGGFPWNLLGASQYQMVPLIQIASVTGIYGVSFLVVWVSLSLLSGALLLLREPTRRSAWIGEIFLPVLVVAILFNLGFRQLRQAAPAARTLRVTLIQPSIPQTLIWDPNSDTQRFQELIRLSEQALTNRTDVLIWPEAAVPKLLRYDKPTFEAVTELARRHHVWMIIGADDAEPRRNTPNPDDADYFNSSFLISPEGELVDRYRKRSLVIFGEYIPLQRWLPFLQFFTPIQGGFTPGDRAGQFALTDLDVKTSVLICFEDIFPHIGRSGVEEDIDFLVNITNNGWFGESAAQWQHATSALFRAIENGRPLIRCSNNGLTCWVDAQGRLRQIFRDARGTVYGAGFMTVEVPVPAPGEKLPLTFYAQHGDWFGWGCVGVAAGVVGWRLWRGWQEKRKKSATQAKEILR